MNTIARVRGAGSAGPASAVRRRSAGSLIGEMMLALGILSLILIPMSFSHVHEQRLCRAYYYRALALEIVDGEMELLWAGAWRAYSPGEHPFTTRAAAAANLPPGQFRLTVSPDRLRLEWRPQGRHQGGPVVREVSLGTERKVGS